MLAATATLGAERRSGDPCPGPGEGHYRDSARPHPRTTSNGPPKRAAVHDVTVLVELHHRTIVASASAAMRLVDGLDPARVGVIHDIGNLVIEGHEDPLAAFQMLGPYLVHVHVKNVAWQAVASPHRTDPPLSGRRIGPRLRERPGRPRGLPASPCTAHGYDGWVTVEDSRPPSPSSLERTQDNLTYLRAVHARAGGTG